MKVTLTQITKQHDVNKLHDALIAAELVPTLVESTVEESSFTFSDVVDPSAVQAVIDAYTYVAPAAPTARWYDTATPDEAIGYKEYTALMSQTGTDDPEVTVIKNTIGPIVWSRTSAGNYIGALLGAFPAGKTALQPMAVDLVNNLNATFITRQDDNQIEVVTGDVSAFPTVTTVDGVLDDALVHVKVYLL